MSAEIELPRPEKRSREVDEKILEDIQKQLLRAVTYAERSPAKISVDGPLAPETIVSLTRWAHRYGYVLHYKAKKTRYYDVPGDIRHEGREAIVYTVALYWATIE